MIPNISYALTFRRSGYIFDFSAKTNNKFLELLECRLESLKKYLLSHLKTNTFLASYHLCMK